jgi:D-alanyl-D-alanine carboxypeptidase
MQKELPRPMPSRCGGTIQQIAGSLPGTTSVTFTSPDGRVQLSVATTLKVENKQAADVGAAIDKAAEDVLCPSDQ